MRHSDLDSFLNIVNYVLIHYLTDADNNGLNLQEILDEIDE